MCGGGKGVGGGGVGGGGVGGGGGGGVGVCKGSVSVSEREERPVSCVIPTLHTVAPPRRL